MSYHSAIAAVVGHREHVSVKTVGGRASGALATGHFL